MKCMKDYLFVDFEKWFSERAKLWDGMGLTISKISYIETPIHSYRITFSAEIEDAATITLYESNSIYWVDIEAWNGVSDELYLIANIEYKSSASIENAIKAFEEYMGVGKYF